MSAAQVEQERDKMLERGYVATPAGRFYLRCNFGLTFDVILAQQAARAADPSKRVFGTCRLHMRHEGACSPRWESNPAGVR